MSKDERDYILTREGANKIQAELEELRGPKRTELAQRLRAAIKQGDLSENADYIAAKEDQAFLEGRIQELEAILRVSEIVDQPASKDVIGVGSTVVIALNGHDPETYHLVGVTEANPREGKISHESPIGKALMGHRAGDTARAETPGGTIELKIVEIR
jgi:transcription elongation factor GreA